MAEKCDPSFDDLGDTWDSLNRKDRKKLIKGSLKIKSETKIDDLARSELFDIPLGQFDSLEPALREKFCKR